MTDAENRQPARDRVVSLVRAEADTLGGDEATVAILARKWV